MTISFETPESIARFVGEANTFDNDINVKCGRYLIDAKSLMGMFSINSRLPIEATLVSDDQKELDRFKEVCSRYQHAS